VYLQQQFVYLAECCKVAKTVDEDKQLIDADFEYVTTIDGNQLVNKPK
jgi:hypothetical protein